jgi:hypothetical protein
MAITVIGADVTVGTPTGPGAEDPLTTSAATPTGTISVTLDVAPAVVSPCQPLVISWTVVNMSVIQGSTLNISYTNIGVLQTGDGFTYNPSPDAKTIAIAPISQGNWAWSPVSITDPGYYVITATGNSDPSPSVKQSSPFLVTAGDSSCLSSSSSSLSSTATAPPSIPSPQSSDPSVSSSGPPSPKIGAIVGGSIAAVVVVGFIVALLLYRRRRNVIAKNVNQRSVVGKGHRKWGGLASIDKTEGEIPVVKPSKSLYGNQAYNRSRSTGRAMTEEEGLEKGYGKDTFPVDGDLLSEMPILHSNRGSRRYSSDAVNTVLRQDSGLAAFSDDHKRRREPKPATPVLSTTTATSGGSEDPFSDAAFIARGNRSSSLSVPSTARAPSRVSDISGRGAPSPLPPVTPVQSQPNSQANTMARNTSATASLGRPSRKPVPQYTDDSIELSPTNRSSPTSQTFPSRQGSGPGPSSSVADLSSSVTSYDALASSAESNSHWLHDRRAPVANRNIGLAGQGDGPVHYLMPDLPPPAR